MEKIRSFIAIELSSELKLIITRLQDRLKSENLASVRWVNPNNIHLTLKFLGDISVTITGKITAVLEDNLRGISPFSLEIGGLGGFPNLRRIQVVWVGLAGEVNRLNQLQHRIESDLVPLGFAPESRPFTPHLTLARIRDRATTNERENIGQLIAKTSFEAGCKMNVNCIHLMRSQLTGQGPIYSRISTVTLQ